MPTNRSLKILMLHGYTQNGPLFHAKTRVMEKSLQKIFPGSTFSYPTAPIRLRPADIPGFDASSLQSSSDESEHYGWWRRAETTEPLEYVGMTEGLSTVAKVLKEEGPFDGVMGFSQGAALAAMVASLLEGESRVQAFQKAQARSEFGIDYPASFAELEHPPLKFCVSYCGFPAPGERYRGFYEDPRIQSKMLHVIGTLDSVVDESRTQALIDAAGGESMTKVLTHPGGHFVPSGKQYIEAVASFIIDSTRTEQIEKKEEEKAEDMDVPF